MDPRNAPELPPPLAAPLVDTHGHLSDPRLFSQADALIARAAQAGVAYVVDPAVDVASARRALDTARRRPDAVRAAIGVHPHEAAAMGADDWLELERLAADPLCLAIGEIGLDAYRVLSPPAEQERALERCLDLARRLGKPVLLHIRDAFARAMEILDAGPPVRGVVHAFWGDAQTASRLIDRGLVIGVGGALTFRREETLRAVIAGLPPDSIVLETDSPYLAPEPMRGRSNEPAYVAYTARRLAAVRRVSTDQVASETTQTARELLGWPVY